jgi:invasion protein IalB
MRRQPRQSSIALGLLLAVVASLMLAACAGGSGTSAEQASQAPAATTSPAAAGQADPLEGEWRAELSCQESVRAVQRRLSAKQMREQRQMVGR